MAFAILAGAPLGGCLVYQVASAPVKVAVGTAEVAGTVAIGTAKLAGGAIGLVAGLAKAGTVTFFDLATNQVTRVPWQRGLTLSGASDQANVGLAQHGVDIVRNGKVVYSAAKGAGQNPAIAAGDVVQVSQ